MPVTSMCVFPDHWPTADGGPTAIGRRGGGSGGPSWAARRRASRRARRCCLGVGAAESPRLDLSRSFASGMAEAAGTRVRRGGGRGPQRDRDQPGGAEAGGAGPNAEPTRCSCPHPPTVRAWPSGGRAPFG